MLASAAAQLRQETESRENLQLRSARISSCAEGSAPHTGPEQLFRSGQGFSELQRTFGRDDLLRRAWLRWRGFQRASLQCLWHDAFAKSHRRGSKPENKTNQDWCFGKYPTVAKSSRSSRRGICDDRLSF